MAVTVPSIFVDIFQSLHQNEENLWKNSDVFGLFSLLFTFGLRNFRDFNRFKFRASFDFKIRRGPRAIIYLQNPRPTYKKFLLTYINEILFQKKRMKTFTISFIYFYVTELHQIFL